MKAQIRKKHGRTLAKIGWALGVLLYCDDFVQCSDAEREELRRLYKRGWAVTYYAECGAGMDGFVESRRFVYIWDPGIVEEAVRFLNLHLPDLELAHEQRKKVAG